MVFEPALVDLGTQRSDQAYAATRRFVRRGRFSEWQVEDEAKCQGGLDGQVGVLQLPSTLADTP